MAVSVAIAQGAAPTAGGVQNLTVPGFGTCKGVLLIVTNSLVNGAPVDHAIFGMGASDGTNHRSFCVSSGHGVSRTNEKRRRSNTRVLTLLRNNGGVDGTALFTSFITDGVRINWSNAPATAVLVTAILFGGTDLNVAVGSFETPKILDATTQVTGLGFTPDQLICFSHRSLNFNTSQPDQMFSLGFAQNPGPPAGVPVQGSINWFANDRNNVSVDPSDVRVHQSTLYTQYNINLVDQGAVQISAFSSDGFDATTRLTADGGAAIFLALAYGGAASRWVGNFDSPTATGDHAITAPAFKPLFVLAGMTFAPSADTTMASSAAGAIGISAMTAANQQCSAAANEDGVTVATNAQSLADVKAVNFPKGDGTAGFVGNFQQFDPLGWTIQYTTSQLTARKWVGLAIGEAASGGDQTVVVPLASAAASTLNETAVPANTTAAGLLTAPASVLAPAITSPATVSLGLLTASSSILALVSAKGSGTATREVALLAAPGNVLSPQVSQGGADQSVQVAVVAASASVLALAKAEGSGVASRTVGLLTAPTSVLVLESAEGSGTATRTVGLLVAAGSVLVPVVGSTGDVTYVDVGSAWRFDSSKWGSGTQFYLEVYARAVSGAVVVHLLNVTFGSIVAGSELDITNSSLQRLRTTAALTLVDASDYILRAGSSSSDSGEVMGARLIPV